MSYFPNSQESAVLECPAMRPGVSDLLQTQGLTVLLLDPDPLQAAEIKSHLITWKIDFFVTDNPALVLRALKEENFDLVLINLSGPEAGDTINSIKELIGALGRNIPVLGLSDSAKDILSAENCDAMLPLPVSEDTWLKGIHQSTRKGTSEMLAV